MSSTSSNEIDIYGVRIFFLRKKYFHSLWSTVWITYPDRLLTNFFCKRSMWHCTSWTLGWRRQVGKMAPSAFEVYKTNKKITDPSMPPVCRLASASGNLWNRRPDTGEMHVEQWRTCSPRVRSIDSTAHVWILLEWKKTLRSSLLVLNQSHHPVHQSVKHDFFWSN